jgi:hypothetical protein
VVLSYNAPKDRLGNQDGPGGGHRLGADIGSRERTLQNLPLDHETNRKIGEQALLILSNMLPGCMARRYDFPETADKGWQLIPCFVDRGPIVPALYLNYGKYLTGVMLFLHCKFMLLSPYDRRLAFPGEKLHVHATLDPGPAAIARIFRDGIDPVQLNALIAAGTAERMLDVKEQSRSVWEFADLGLCAAWLGRYDQARALFRQSVAVAERIGQPPYLKLRDDSKAMLDALDSNPARVRRELIARLDDNWSHFKVVAT